VEDENGHKPGFKDLIKQLTKNPLLLLVIVAAIVGIILIIAKQNQQIQAGSNPTTPASPSGGSAGAGGVPQQTTNLFFYAKDNNQDAGAPATIANTAANTPSGNTPQQLQPTTNATSMTSPSSDPWHTAQIRAKGSIPGDVQRYDAQASGVPIWSQPGATPGSQIGTIDFGSKIQEQGMTVQGGSNFGPNSTTGSNLWYKVQSGGKTGYVSAYDVQNVS